MALSEVRGDSRQGQFVINLCTLLTPITVPQPRASRLQRYSFFLSRCTINGQRQYQLQMGYFATAAEADKWLTTLKRIYPDAHVSDAPEAQPELLTNTQTLRVLNLGQVDSEESTGATTRRQRAVTDLPSSRELFVRDTSTTSTARRRDNPTLEDTLNELRSGGFDGVVPEDDLDGTGVRHIRIDVMSNGAAPRTRKAGR